MPFTRLWRPTGPTELALVRDSDWRSWPPRLPDQPIFYPVMNRWYATKIAREWNVPSSGAGFVTSFDVESEFLRRYEVQRVGGRDVLELWIPAEELAELNRHIVGTIRVETEFRAALTDMPVSSLHDVPTAWRDYLTGPSWLRIAAVEDGRQVTVFTPDEATHCRQGRGLSNPVLAQDEGGNVAICRDDIVTWLAPGDASVDADERTPLSRFIARLDGGYYAELNAQPPGDG